MTAIARHQITANQLCYSLLKGIFNHFVPEPQLERSVHYVTSYFDDETIEYDECPEFQQIFELGGDVILGIEYLTMCPEETALIRVVSDETVSKQFKKKVLYSAGRSSQKYINFNGKRLYLSKCKVYLE